MLVGKRLSLLGKPRGLVLDWARATAPGDPTRPNHRFLLPFYIGNNVSIIMCGMIELKLVYNRLQMWFELVIGFVMRL